MQTEEMRLDGNAVAGSLLDVFSVDVTAAMATCAGCGAERLVGALLEYGHGMGVVLRCPGCDSVMIRLVRAPGYVRLDATGVSVLTIPTDDGASVV
jgi:hypothetical protein